MPSASHSMALSGPSFHRICVMDVGKGLSEVLAGLRTTSLPTFTVTLAVSVRIKGHIKYFKALIGFETKIKLFPFSKMCLILQSILIKCFYFGVSAARCRLLHFIPRISVTFMPFHCCPVIRAVTACSLRLHSGLSVPGLSALAGMGRETG